MESFVTSDVSSGFMKDDYFLIILANVSYSQSSLRHGIRSFCPLRGSVFFIHHKC